MLSTRRGSGSHGGVVKQTALRHNDIICVCSVYGEVVQVEALTLTFDVIDLLLQGNAEQVCTGTRAGKVWLVFLRQSVRSMCV